MSEPEDIEKIKPNMKVRLIGGPLDGQENEVRGGFLETWIVVAWKPLSLKPEDICCYFDEAGYPIFPKRTYWRRYTYELEFDNGALVGRYRHYKNEPPTQEYEAPGEWQWKPGYGPDVDPWDSPQESKRWHCSWRTVHEAHVEYNDIEALYKSTIARREQSGT